jgi:hypothetical protein
MWCDRHAHAMKTHTKNKPLTLGDFVMRVYDTCEAQRAAVIVWLAMQTQQVVLQKQGAQVSRNVAQKARRRAEAAFKSGVITPWRPPVPPV